MIRTAILVLVCFVFIVCVQAQTTSDDAVQAYNDAVRAYENAAQQEARGKLRAQKKEIVRQAISLSTEQSRDFWPIYDKHEAETARINDTRLALLQDYLDHRASMTAEKAGELINRIMQVQLQRQGSKRAYVKELGTVLTAKQALRLLLLETQLDVQVDAQIAAQIPL